MRLEDFDTSELYSMSEEELAILEEAIFGEVYDPLQKYCPQKPFPKQRAFLDLTCEEAFFGGAAGPGKALHVDTPIPTPFGFVRMGDLQPGDIVYGRDGGWTMVLAATDVMMHPSYKVKFDDGAEIVADADHLWLTFDYKERTALAKRNDEYRAKRRASRPSRATRTDLRSVLLAERNRDNPTATKPAPTGTLRTTRKIADTLTVRGSRRNHSVPVCGELKGRCGELPIEPYCLGAWLGDGSTGKNDFSCHPDDSEIIEEIKAAGWPVQFRGKFRWLIGTTERRQRANGRGFGMVNSWGKALRDAGVHSDKHVPEQYFESSPEQRLALLQGLMDTDGNVGNGQVEFTNTNRRLAEAVARLANSFGWKCKVRTGNAKLHGKIIGKKYRVGFTPDRPVFRLTRKRDSQPIAARKTNNWRYIVSAEFVGVQPVRCIQVCASDGMFLAGREMVPTHNSSALLMGALQYVHVPGYSALILRRDFQRLALPGSIMDRSHEWLANTDARWNGSTKTWRFPSGATIQFGYIDNPTDRFRYASSEYQYIAWDEMTEILLTDDESNPYLFLFSRLRKTSDLPVPLRVRAASNPGNISHAWVKRRFITKEATDWMMENRDEIKVFYTDRGQAFIPGVLRDNPAIDPEQYIPALSHLPRVTRERLLKGDWSVREDSLINQSGIVRYRIVEREIQILDDDGTTLASWHEDDSYRFATIDPAGTSQDKAKTSRGKDHSSSVIGVFERCPKDVGNYLICRFVWRKKVGFNNLCDGIRQINEEWNPQRIRIENEKLGVAVVDVLADELPIDLVPTGGKDKVSRAGRLMQMVERREFGLPVSAAWLDTYESEVFTWTGHPDEPSDQVDISAYAAMESDGKGAGLWAPHYFNADVWVDGDAVQVGRTVACLVPVDPNDVGTEGINGAIVSVSTRSDGLIYVDAVISNETPTSMMTRFREAEAFGRPAHAIAVPTKWVETTQIVIPAAYDYTAVTPIVYAVDVKLSEFSNPESLTPAFVEQKLRFARTSGCRRLVNIAKSFPHTKDIAPLQALGYAIETLAAIDRTERFV